MTFFWDSETEPFSAACSAPPIICIQFCDDTSRPWLMTRDGLVTDGSGPDAVEQGPLPEALLENQLLRNENVVGQNIAFDWACALAAWPQLTPLVWQAYREDRVHDTLYRQKLADIGRGRYRTRQYNLESLSAIHGGPAISKKDPWRRRYILLKNVRLPDWYTFETTVIADEKDAKDGIAPLGSPIHLRGIDAIRYALLDAEATRAAYLGQEARYDPELLVDACSQARKFWALQLASVWGIRTSARGVASLREGVEKRIEQLRGILTEPIGCLCERPTLPEEVGKECFICGEPILAGLLRPNGTRDTKTAKHHMKRVCDALGVPVATTKGDDISLSSDACDATEDELLKAYTEYSSMAKTLSTDVPMLERGLVMPLHSHFDLVESGRTSSAKPNIQNIKRNGLAIRECFVPRGFDSRSYELDGGAKKG